MKVLTIFNSFHLFLIYWQTPIAIIDNGVIPITSAHQQAAGWDLSKKEQCTAHSGLSCLAEHVSPTCWQASEFILPCICLNGTVKNLFMVKDGI